MTDAYDIYIYHEGYLRTSSEAFSLDLRSTKTAASGAGASAQMVHLTNYCMQKHSKNLGKFEEGNTLKYDDLQVMCQRDGDGGSLLEREWEEDADWEQGCFALCKSLPTEMHRVASAGVHLSAVSRCAH